MHSVLRTLLLTAPIATLLTVASSCSFANDLQQYHHRQPPIDFDTYFLGTTIGYGQITSRTGRITQEFTVVINGVQEGEQLAMYEKFAFTDGRTIERVWRVSKKSDNSYYAVADDVPGGAEGTAVGNVIRWKYRLNTEKFNNSNMTLTLDDWMFRQSEQIVINRARMSKFGVEVSQMLVVFTKVSSKGIENPH